jgi:hypothetical protein
MEAVLTTLMDGMRFISSSSVKRKCDRCIVVNEGSSPYLLNGLFGSVEYPALLKSTQLVHLVYEDENTDRYVEHGIFLISALI